MTEVLMGPLRADRLVILGSSLTALGVMRSARSLGLKPVLIDTEKGIATCSSAGETIVTPDEVEELLLNRVCSLGKKGNSVLLATSDRWLRFIIANRQDLDRSYARILHPPNEVLETCLDKLKFLEWCGRNGIHAPNHHTFHHVDGILPGGAAAGIRFPLLLRPRSTSHSWTSNRVPKAFEVKDPTELESALGRYFEAAIDVVGTESLLGHEVTQFSIPVARGERGTVSFVAEKVRPLAVHCSVGTYVRLHPDRKAEELARLALDRLEYEGIAEVEILRSGENGQYYVIEINARPWVQYALATRSGHDFIGFLLFPGDYDPRKEVKAGKAWINFSDDLFVCFSRSLGVVRNGIVGYREYVRSLLDANVHSKFDWSDPMPFVRDAWDGFVRFVRRKVGWQEGSKNEGGRPGRQKTRQRVFESISRALYGVRLDRVLGRVSNRWSVRKGDGGIRIPVVGRRRQRSLLVLAYHRVNDHLEPFFPAMAIGTFERQMEYLTNSCITLPLEDAVERLRHDDLPESAVSITFDDGYRDNYLNAFPILRKYSVPATIFLSTGAIGGVGRLWHDRVIQSFIHPQTDTVEFPFSAGRKWSLVTQEGRILALREALRFLRRISDGERVLWVEEILSLVGEAEQDVRNAMLTWEDVRAMLGERISFGAHTLSHPVLSRMTREQAHREIVESKRLLSSVLGVPVLLFAYPFGLEQDFTEETKTIVQEAGFSCAMTSIFGFQSPGQDLFEMRRGMPWEESIASFAVKMGWYRLLS